MQVKNYLNLAKDNANQRYMSFAGFNANAQQAAPQYMNANGGNNAPQSQPYIITVSNASATAVSNFDVLGAYTYINGGTGTYSNGSLTIGSVTISSAISNVTY